VDFHAIRSRGGEHAEREVGQQPSLHAAVMIASLRLGTSGILLRRAGTEEVAIQRHEYIAAWHALRLPRMFEETPPRNAPRGRQRAWRSASVMAFSPIGL